MSVLVLTVRMKDYVDIFPKKIVFQGNLDPIKLLAGGKRNEEKHYRNLKGYEKNFIFNLGHGILPQTPEKMF